jgi:hypothetical protein
VGLCPNFGLAVSVVAKASTEDDTIVKTKNK